MSATATVISVEDVTIAYGDNVIQKNVPSTSVAARSS
jgi:hypothetical protein